jgi:hypothetical protein
MLTCRMMTAVSSSTALVKACGIKNEEMDVP